MEDKNNYPPHVLELENKLASFFRTMKERHVQDAAQTDMSMPQFFCLWIISKCGKLRMSDLATNLALSYASATNLINRLSEAELVNRYDDPEDRRVVIVELSKKGKDLTESVRTKHMNEMMDKCTKLNHEQIDIVLKGMDILIDIVSFNRDKNSNNNGGCFFSSDK